ncbi:MAG: biopolymer transporter ExbD [Betaproteobacteria bacterium]|jgi:biopolymer transport protein ExbD|nr:biopolymer transporter ExbD [Betaproteobacteria bacterium]
MNFRITVKEDLEINLIPMIDVLLVILIFLMVTTTYSKFAELQINLPSAQAEKQPERPSEINVTVSASGEYTIDRKPVVFGDVNSFAQAMRSAGAGLKDPVIVINADANASHQSVIKVMEAARAAGYAQVSFAVDAAAR